MQKRLNNEEGMTLISVLFALAVILTALPLLSFVFMKVVEANTYEDLKFEQFFHFIHNDALNATHVLVINNSIVFESINGDQSVLSKYNNLIRRQVNNEGHEIYLRDIKSFNVSR